jgi:hypothetical protein
LLAAKVLGCAVLIYIAAGILVSFKRLLPILAIACGVATILSLSHIQKSGATEMFWLPIVLSLATQLCYQGEGYMNPKIQENLYRLVSVERKWQSIFAEYDEYELHYSPAETGGFVENTILFGGAFALYYMLTSTYDPTGWAMYIWPIFLVGMSVIDLLMVLGKLNISSLFYGFLRTMVLLAAIVIGILGPFGGKAEGDSLKNDALFEKCHQLATLNYAASYEVRYEFFEKDENYDYIRIAEKRFIYDAELQTGAEYLRQNGENIYQSIYTRIPEFGNRVVELYNAGGAEEDFRFADYAEEVDGAFKYFTVEGPQLENYYELTQRKYNGARQVIRNLDDRWLNIVWSDGGKISDFAETYTISYYFNTDGEGNPISLDHIAVYIYPNRTEKVEIIYSPIYGETPLAELFDEDAVLKNYTCDEG